MAKIPDDTLGLEDLLSAREELEQIAEALREADEAEKTAKGLKSDLRGPFLDLISEVVRDEVPLARRNETVSAEELERSDGDFETWRARNFPEWNIVGIAATKAEDAAAADSIVTLEENDQFKKFSFTSNGFKFGRTFKMVESSFRSKEFLEEVAKRDDISRTLLHDLLGTVTTETVIVHHFDEPKANALMTEHPETVKIFQEYFDPGKPQVSLLPITKAKDEE